MHRQTHKNKTVKMGIEDHANQFDSFKFDERERKNNAVNRGKTAYGKGFGVPEVIRTPDLPLWRRSLYPAELRKRIFTKKLWCLNSFCLLSACVDYITYLRVSFSFQHIIT